MEIKLIKTKDALMMIFLIEWSRTTAARIADINGTAIRSKTSSI